MSSTLPNLLTTIASPWRSTPESNTSTSQDFQPLEIPRRRIYPGDDGNAEHDREAQWSPLPPTYMGVYRPADVNSGPNSQRPGRIYIHLRCNCCTRRGHGFDRCNRHISPIDSYRGFGYCIQCVQHRMICRTEQYKRRCSYVATGIVWSEHLFLMKPTLRTEDAAAVKPFVRDSPQGCRCDCAGCIGPEPEQEPPVVTQILEPSPKRVHRS